MYKEEQSAGDNGSNAALKQRQGPEMPHFPIKITAKDNV